MERLDSTGDVIDALGGTSAVARLFGFDARVVSNWRTQARFPARTFLIFRDALRSKGFDVPERLWAMAEPRQTEPGALDSDTPQQSVPVAPTPGEAA